MAAANPRDSGHCRKTALMGGFFLARPRAPQGYAPPGEINLSRCLSGRTVRRYGHDSAPLQRRQCH